MRFLALHLFLLLYNIVNAQLQIVLKRLSFFNTVIIQITDSRLNDIGKFFPFIIGKCFACWSYYLRKFNNGT